MSGGGSPSGARPIKVVQGVRGTESPESRRVSQKVTATVLGTPGRLTIGICCGKDSAMTSSPNNAGGNADGSASPRVYLKRQEAASYLSVSLRWLEGNQDIPKIDLARPGSTRSMWRYKRSDLDAWLAAKAHPILPESESA